MKLVDILARELNQWPDALGHAAGQAADGTLHSEMEPEDAETVWTIESYTICSNWIIDIVTRAEWQAAVDALNADKCEHSYANKIGCPECGELNAPKVVEWDGEGLPPAGSTCEHSTDDNKNNSADGGWKKVKIVGHHQFHNDDYLCAVWVSGTDVSYSSEGEHFRPIRTAEQVAAEEREAEDNEVMSRYMSLSDCEKGMLGHSPERVIIGLMRVMGYRKEPKPCGS